MSSRHATAARGFSESLGPLGELLAEQTLTDLHRNADGSIHVRHYGSEPTVLGLSISDAHANSIVRLAADLAGTVVTEDRPLLRSTLPDGSRFQGVIPPVSPAPAFSIRRHRVRELSLDDFVTQGILTEPQCRAIKAAIRDRRNILITGETGVGKTTLLNAMLREPSVMAGRLFIAEDTREIRAPGHDVVQLCTSDAVSLRDLVVTALRMRPDRIVIGETRSGDAAIEMLKAWTTAHRGGFSTLHADSAGAFFLRLTTLLQEVVAGGTDALIGYAVDLVAHLASTPSGPRCTELISVGWKDGALSLHTDPRTSQGDPS